MHIDVQSQILLDAKADVDQGTKTDLTPCYLATQNDHSAVVELLISHGADVDKVNDYGAFTFSHCHVRVHNNGAAYVIRYLRLFENRLHAVIVNKSSTTAPHHASWVLTCH